jgi:hypothetical protein
MINKIDRLNSSLTFMVTFRRKEWEKRKFKEMFKRRCKAIVVNDPKEQTRHKKIMVIKVHIYLVCIWVD